MLSLHACTWTEAYIVLLISEYLNEFVIYFQVRNPTALKPAHVGFDCKFFILVRFNVYSVQTKQLAIQCVFVYFKE